MSAETVTRKQLTIGAITGIGLAGGATLISTLLVPLWPVVIFGAGVAGLVGGTFIPNKDKSITSPNESEVDYLRIYAEQLPKDLEKEFNQLQRVGILHKNRETTLVQTINDVLGNVHELFIRVSKKANDQSAQLAALNYTDILKKLNKALGEDYYLDIVDNMKFWDDPLGRMETVKKALDATDKQLLANIRQVNASRDIEFDSALDSLIANAENTLTETYATE